MAKLDRAEVLTSSPIALLAEVDAWRVDRHRLRAADAELHSPAFSPLDYLDRRENSLSRIFAWLLDPRGTHEQGPRFLVAYLDWSGLGPEWTADASAARVWTEMPTSSRAGAGFMDILVRMGGRALAIENKPKAVDQPQQVARYLDDLAFNCRHGHCLVYLSGDGRAPATTSISKARMRQEVERGTLLVRGYSNLVDWLQVCISLCRSSMVNAMLEGIIRHIRKDYMGVSDISEADALTGLICSSPQKLASALAIIEAGDLIKANIISGLIGNVRELLAVRKGWHILRDDLSSTRYSALIIGFAPSSSIGVGLQFDHANYGWLFYGVHSAKARPLPLNIKKAMQELHGAEAKTDWWPVWKSVGPNDRFFPFALHADTDFWLAAQNGRVAQLLVEYVAEVEVWLRARRLLTAFRER